MKRSVRRMKPVFHTQIDLSMAEMPRKTKMMVSDPLARTFMTYLTVVTDFSSMFALMYFWQHIPQKRTLQTKHAEIKRVPLNIFMTKADIFFFAPWGTNERMADSESISAVR